MDGCAAIADNLQALRRIVGGLFAMAGFAVPQAGGSAAGPCLPTETGLRTTLPRHLRLAVLRLLRPAEAAARRLIIAAALGLVVTPPLARKTVPRPVDPAPLLRRLGIAVVLSSDAFGCAGGYRRAVNMSPARPRNLTLPLFDRSRRIGLSRRHYVPAHAAPRILSPGFAEPHILPSPPSPDDAVDTGRLGHRIAALAAALDDLPGQARRFARWRARQRQQPAHGSRRVSPLRPGRPPGGRLARFDPSARRSRNVREVDIILARAHSLALYALHPPDTS